MPRWRLLQLDVMYRVPRESRLADDLRPAAVQVIAEQRAELKIFEPRPIMKQRFEVFRFRRVGHQRAERVAGVGAARDRSVRRVGDDLRKVRQALSEPQVGQEARSRRRAQGADQRGVTDLVGRLKRIGGVQYPTGKLPGTRGGEGEFQG